eukprot:824262_1
MTWDNMGYHFRWMFANSHILFLLFLRELRLKATTLRSITTTLRRHYDQSEISRDLNQEAHLTEEHIFHWFWLLKAFDHRWNYRFEKILTILRIIALLFNAKPMAKDAVHKVK